MNTSSFVSAFKAIPFPILILFPDDPVFSVAEVNPAFLKIVNRNESDILGKSIFDFFPENKLKSPKPTNDLLKSLREVTSSKKPHKMPVQKYVVGGEGNNNTEKRYFECENIPLLSECGKLEHIVFTAKDITEKEMAMRQLKSDGEKLLAAQQIAKIGYWKFDIVKDKLFWSEEIYKILGINKDDVKLSYELFFDAIHPDDKETFAKVRSAAYSGEREMDLEFRILQVDGSQKWVREIGKLVKNESGEPVAFEGTIQDITTATLLKLSLEETNLRYHYASKATFDSIYDWDIITDKCYWGEGFIRDFGYDSETLADNYFWKNMFTRKIMTVW